MPEPVRQPAHVRTNRRVYRSMNSPRACRPPVSAAGAMGALAGGSDAVIAARPGYAPPSPQSGMSLTRLACVTLLPGGTLRVSQTLPPLEIGRESGRERECQYG